MKRTIAILACVLAAGLARGQSPQILQNVRDQMNTVQKNASAASNEALGINKSSAPVKGAPAANSAPATAQKSVAPKKAPAKSVAAAGEKHSVTKKAVKVAAPAPAPDKEKKAAAVPVSSPVASAAVDQGAVGAEEAKNSDKDVQDKKWSMTGKRDPFISPVVNRAGGSGCSTGKKCLEIGAINLRGVVHSDQGYIAVVTNSLNKAYFLRENDPVFDGYVVKITGDSIVFQETMQDRLGKTFTREVVKKITTPAV